LFAQWHRDTNESPVCWSELERNDFRLFLRQLGRRELSQAAIRLRFSALNSFYKFLMRRGLVESSPVKDVTLPKPAKRLPQFLTIDQMNALLDAPMQEFEAERVAKKGTGKKTNQVPYLRDGAILETIYSCGLRIGEICRMLAGEIEPDEHVSAAPPSRQSGFIGSAWPSHPHPTSRCFSPQRKNAVPSTRAWFSCD